jgi:hypothetical protein
VCSLEVVGAQECDVEHTKMVSAASAHWPSSLSQYRAKVCQANIILFSRFIFNCYSFFLTYGHYAQEKSRNRSP